MEHIRYPHITIQQGGYLSTFLSSADGNPVSFDNMQVTYYQGTEIEQDHYYPFGLTLQTQSTETVSQFNNIKYNSKELQQNEFNDVSSGAKSGLEWYDYGARMMDMQLGRWLQVDPMADSMRRFSPYSFAFDNPERFIDNDGAWPHSIHIRSFAPFETFGGGFEGDNRSYTTMLSRSEGGSATSRIQYNFSVDPTNHTYAAGNVWSDGSSHPILGTGNATSNDKANISGFTSSTNGDGNNTVSFTANMAGANPLVPGSPDIDVHTKFTLTENESAGTLNVKAVQTGDAFPSAETFIADTKGNQLFIGVSPANGSPYTSLPGDNNRTMMSSNFTVTMDKNGTFTGVIQGNKTYTVGQWNTTMQSQKVTQE